MLHHDQWLFLFISLTLAFTLLLGLVGVTTVRTSSDVCTSRSPASPQTITMPCSNSNLHGGGCRAYAIPKQQNNPHEKYSME